MRPLRALFLIATVLGLGACERVDPEQARANLGLPPASFQADTAAGSELYQAHCAQCHGTAGGGSRQGPPLVHRGYGPEHHADLAFYRAVKDGVVQHHWGFGDMPPLPELNSMQVGHILAYVRDAQRQAGIQ